MDACPKCTFSAIRPYTPSVNATDLLQRGFSSLDISQASILNDITNLEQELDEIEPLFIQIRDRREKLLKDLRGCKALLAPIRRLPRETLIQIFGLASSDIPDPRDAPWILGEVCSTWRGISRSCPSLWTRIHISTFGRNYSTFLETYISLSVHLPIHMSVERQLNHKDTDILRCLALHLERWSVLELTMTGQGLSHLLSLASSPAIHLTKLSLLRVGVDQPEINHAAVNCLFSSSPITEVCLRRIPYSSMPINTTHLLKLHMYSYDPAKLYSTLQRSERLVEFFVELASPHDGLINTASISYPPMIHASLQRLSFDMTRVNPRRRTNVPVTIDYVTLPALRQFDILATEPRAYILSWPFQAIEYTRLIGLFHRSQCSLTVLTISVPMSVEAFLIPVLSQSPALQKLDIFVNASIARDAFKALALEQGKVPCLEQLYITDAPIRMENSGLLEDAGGCHAMILSRLGGDSRLDTLHLSLKTHWSYQPLVLPVPQDSPFHDLFRIKDEGMNVEFVLDRKDCLVDEEARASFFGSS
ncbi:hypothetical protein EV421DRAFT_1834381 [Armillaria borealis]|uniref:F-box domain-containing protein n=1 Tax=Armillaria borealis TaxID=47425 RepID=A0AA39MJ45_9AGAR|nr:hypothetical protein EV421DRAFT_1834381 [Armillaria borealis]